MAEALPLEDTTIAADSTDQSVLLDYLQDFSADGRPVGLFTVLTKDEAISFYLSADDMEDLSRVLAHEAAQLRRF